MQHTLLKKQPSRKYEDLTGKIFGRWNVLKLIGKKGAYYQYECICKCGIKKNVFSNALKHGKSKSCGCLHREITSEVFKKHGLINSSEYNSWDSMKQRCCNENNSRYTKYGGKGIKVCRRWLGRNGFKNFINDMGLKPSLKHTIERVNNKKGYSPDNCKWATKKEQNRNNSRNIYITHNGETRVLKDWSGYNGLSYDAIRWRFNNYGYYHEIFDNKRLNKELKQKYNLI